MELKEEVLVAASGEQSSWERIVTWVAEDSVVTGDYDDVGPGNPDECSLKQVDQEEESGRLTKSAADFSHRIQAVAKREAEALVDKVSQIPDLEHHTARL